MRGGSIPVAFALPGWQSADSFPLGMSDAPVPLRFAHFDVLRKADGSLWELGRGGMGVTYKAFDTKLQIDVVLKLPHEQLMGTERNLRMFLREARAAAKVRHPNIAAVIQLNDEPPYCYVMEFVAGQPLDQLLKEKKTLPLGEALDILDQVASALHALSGAQIVHRDLKPANLVLLADDERPFNRTVKLIDFGLAKGFAIEGAEAATFLHNSFSQAGVFSGTPVFASPEQCAGASDLDTRSDLYSAGVILWHMLTGGVPFTGTMQQIMAKHQMQPPPWAALADVPEPVVALLRRLLEKQPEDRYQTPRELREAIRAAETRMTGAEKSAAGVITVSAALSPITESLTLGTTLVERYHLGIDMGEGDGGRLFRAADHATGDAPVAVKVLSAERLKDATFVDSLTRQLAGMRTARDPVWLAPLGGLERTGQGGFFAREWAEGFSLDELLRARHGELSAPEVWRLLQTLPTAIDRAAQESFGFAEPVLRKLFVTPEAGSEPDEDWPALRSKPIKKWPAFVLRWNAVSFRGRPSNGLVTQVGDGEISATEDPVACLAVLVRQLLGGAPNALTPLSALRGEANAVLQRALGPGGGKLAFRSAQEFWNELQRASELRPSPMGGGGFGGLPTIHDAPVQPVEPQVAVIPLSSAGYVVRAPSSGIGKGLLIAIGVVVTVVALGSGLFWAADSWIRSRSAQSTSPMSATAVQTPVVETPRPAAATILPMAIPTVRPTAVASALPTPMPTAVPTLVPTPIKSASDVFAGKTAGETAGERKMIIGIPFRWCPPGIFTMGSPKSEKDRADNEVQHDVTLTRGYWLAETELTQTQWKRFVSKNPSPFQGDKLPVVKVSWEDVAGWCQKASEELSVEGWEVALPTEAQWEYAARAGVPESTPWWFGDSLSSNQANFDGTKPGGNASKGLLMARTAPVGDYPEGGWGLRDMHGNVWEWCADWYGEYPTTALRDPTGPQTGADRVYRGGGGRGSARDCRSAYRSRGTPDFRYEYLGFRPAIVPSALAVATPVVETSRPAPTPSPTAVPTPVPTLAETTVKSASESFAGKTAGERKIIIGIPFRWCPPGTFTMGSPTREKGRVDNETQHEVTLKRGYWLAETELTQAQWKRFVSQNRSMSQGETLPVDSVSWDDAVGWCQKASGELSVAGWAVALPTEAQWEYAARAGVRESPWWFGGSLSSKQANFDGNTPGGNAAKGPYLRKTAPVGSHTEGGWGLQDMHGNVWEWCADLYGDYPTTAVSDPTGPRTGAIRVSRGGSWLDDARYCRSACRGGLSAVFRPESLGFRPAVVPSAQ